MTRRIQSLLPVLLGLLLLAPGCTTLQQLAALRQVDFALDRLSNGLVAGVNIDRIAAGGNVGLADAARIGAAAAAGEVPLSFTLNVGAQNPSENAAAAQLVSLDWTLFLEDTETISGVYNDDRLIPPGETVNLPIAMELDLARFFGRNAGDLIDLVSNLAGAGGQPQMIRLEAQPTVQTSLGPIRYPGTVSIEFPVGRTTP